MAASEEWQPHWLAGWAGARLRGAALLVGSRWLAVLHAWGPLHLMRAALRRGKEGRGIGIVPKGSLPRASALSPKHVGGSGTRLW